MTGTREKLLNASTHPATRHPRRGDLDLTEAQKTKVAQGKLRDILAAESGDDVKVVRRALLKSMAVTEPLVVELRDKSVVLKPPLGPNESADCASSQDRVEFSGQIAYLEAGQRMQYCFQDQKFEAEADADGVIHPPETARRLSTRQLSGVDCSSANVTTAGDEIIITAPDRCAYDATDNSFSPCLAGHSCTSGNQTPCPAMHYQDAVGQSTCKECGTGEYNVGTETWPAPTAAPTRRI